MLFKGLLKMGAVCAIAVGGMTWLAASQGKDPMAYFSAMQWRMPDIALPDVTLPDLPALPTRGDAGPTVVYRWVDTSGTVQFSTTPPVDQLHERLLIDPNANVLPAIPTDAAATHNPRSPAQRETSGLPPVQQFSELNSQLDAVQSSHAERTDRLDAQLRQQLQ